MSKNLKNKCFYAVDDFEELVNSNEILMCFLQDYNKERPKAPEGKTEFYRNQIKIQWDNLSEEEKNKYKDGWDGYLKSFNGKYNLRYPTEANLSQNINRNLGFTLPKEIKTNEFWVVIDVDGQDYSPSMKNNNELKIATREFFFEILKNGFKERGINAMYVSTASHGYHIYFKVTQAKEGQHGFDAFTYPFSVHSTDRVYEIFSKNRILNSILNSQVNNGALEIFTHGSMVVAPGSVINGVEYKVLPDGVQRFGDVSVYKEKPVQDLIKDILVDANFFYTPPENNESEKSSTSNEIKILEDINVERIGNGILKGFPEISNQKHEATLAIGGFLADRGISTESIKAIGNYVLDNAPANLFKMSIEQERTNGFMKTLLHDSLNPSTNSERIGMSTIRKIFKGTSVEGVITKILWTNAKPNKHIFYPLGKDSSIFIQVIIDFENMIMVLRRLKWVKNSDGIIDKNNMKDCTLNIEQFPIKHILDDFSYINDISASEVLLNQDKAICFTLKKREKTEEYMFENTPELFKKYYNLPGTHGMKKSNILEYIMNEYEDIDLIEEKEGSTKPGIYISKETGELKKFFSDGINGIQEAFPKKPDKQQLTNALKLLKKINDVYPWHDDKFAVFVKLGMILPYSFILKTKYNDFIRGIILHGEAGTLKTTASILLEYLNVPAVSIKNEEKRYISSGSEFDSVYRMGRALDSHSYPITVNEVESLFNNQEKKDLIKNAITSPFVREPGGDEPKIYYARAVPIFSLNNLNEEMEKSDMFRRFLMLNFVEGERGDTKEAAESLKFLNKDKKKNSRFEELYVIGEYIFYTLHKNQDYLTKTPQDIADSVIKDMQEYTNLDLEWLLEPQFEKYEQNDRSEESENDFDEVIGAIKSIKNSRFTMNFPSSENIFNEKMLNDIVENSDDIFVYRVKNKVSNGVLINVRGLNKSIKKRNFKNPNLKKFSIDRVIELLNNHLEPKYQATHGKYTITKSVGRKKGVFVHWVDFCKIFNIDLEKEGERNE